MRWLPASLAARTVMLVVAVLAGPLALVLAYEVADHFELNLFHVGDT